MPEEQRERIIARVSRRVSSPIFIGRVAERAALSEALERAADGQPGVVLVSGEAGIGKTRLLAEATTHATSEGVTTVAGLCVDVAAGTLPLGPFIDIVRDLHRAGLTTSLPVATRAELGRLSPEVAPGAGNERTAGQGGQGRLFAAVRDAISVSSAAQPIQVTIEDLHWADASTLDLVTYLARSLQTERCVLILTARLDTLPKRHPVWEVVAELGRLASFERIELGRFDERELAQQLTGILGALPDPDTARNVFERSDGNAFFAEELVATSAAGSGALPASLREVLAARLAALDDATQQVVRVAAVAGRVVNHELLERVAGVPPAALIAALREAVEQRVLVRLVDPVSGYAFRHALLREAASDELLEAERVAIHRAIADALERDAALAPGGDLARAGEIAYHAMAAHDLSRALMASLDAAAAAEHASAYPEAETHLARILEIWPQVPDAAMRIGMDRPALLARTARAAASAGHLPRAAALAEEVLVALDSGDDERRVQILLDLFDYAWEAADLDTSERVLNEAMPILRDERSARSAHAFAAEAHMRWHYGRYTSAREAAEQAIAIARECDARGELARALTSLALVQTHTGETTSAEASFAEAADLFEGVNDPELRARSTRWRAWARYLHGRFEESLAMSHAGLEVARREGSDGRYGVDLVDGTLENLIELGRWPEARETGDRIVARMVTSLEMIGARMSLARLATLEGRFTNAEEEIVQAAHFFAVGPHLLWQLEDAVFLAYATGRFDDGRRHMEAAIAASAEPERDAILWWPLRKAVGGEADRAEAAHRRRRSAEADEAVAAGRRFAELLRRNARAAIATGAAGQLVRAELAGAEAEERRLEGRPDPVLWAGVVLAREALGQPWEAAYAKYRLAEAILAGGGAAAEAAEPLGAAHVTARGLGAAPLQTAIEALATRARIQLERPLGDDGPIDERPMTTLTARELEVLTLVAAGHTNREIGERLFISEKTASVHVTHAMDKLGALSRYEAAAAATRLGLLPATP